MLKKTSAYTGLVIVTAAGALLTSSPAYALDSLARGGSFSHHHRSHHRNRNWNGHRHHGRIFIRIYIYNKNNNHAIAVARPEHSRRALVLRDSAPFTDDPGVRGRVGALRAPTTASRGNAANETPASTDESPASANQAPVNAGTTPVDQGGAGNTPGAVGAPGAPRTASNLDEGATGNVSP